MQKRERNAVWFNDNNTPQDCEPPSLGAQHTTT
jgi:hypothetical protein